MSPDGTMAAYRTRVGSGFSAKFPCVVFDTNTWLEIALDQIAAELPNGAAVLSGAFSPDSSLLAIGASVVVGPLVFDTTSWAARTVAVTISGATAIAPVWTPDGSRLIWANGSGVYVLDATNDFNQLHFFASTGIKAIGIAEAGQQIACFDQSAGTITLINLSDYGVAGTVSVVDPLHYRSGETSPDGSMFCLAGNSQGEARVIVFDLSTASIVFGPVLPGLSGNASGVAWRDDGAFLSFVVDSLGRQLYRVSTWAAEGSIADPVVTVSRDGQLGLVIVTSSAGTPQPYSITYPFHDLVEGFDDVRVVDYTAGDTGAAIATAVAADLAGDLLVESAIATGNQVTITNLYPGEVVAREVDVALATVTVDEPGNNPNYAPPPIAEIGPNILLTHYHDTASPAIAFWLAGVFAGSVSISESSFSLWNLSHDSNGLTLWANGQTLATVPDSESGTQDLLLHLNSDRNVRIDDVLVSPTATLPAGERDAYYAAGVPWSSGIDFLRDLLIAPRQGGKIVAKAELAADSITTPAVRAAAVNDPDGNQALYAMDQNVRTTDVPSFAGLILTTPVQGVFPTVNLTSTSGSLNVPLPAGIYYLYEEDSTGNTVAIPHFRHLIAIERTPFTGIDVGLAPNWGVFFVSDGHPNTFLRYILLTGSSGSFTVGYFRFSP